MKKLILILLLFLAVKARAQIDTSAVEALQYYQQGYYEKAFPLYQKLFTEGHNSFYYDEYFNCLLKLKKYDEAKELLKELLREDPGNSTYKVDYGRILQESGNEAKASEWYDQLIKGLPKNEIAVRDLATSFYRAEAFDFSVKTFLAGRNLLKNKEAFAYELIALYKYQRNKGMMVQEYLNVLNRDPNVLSQAQTAILNVMVKPEDYNLLSKMLTDKLDQYPHNPVYNELLAWTYLQQNDYEEALKQAIFLDKKLHEEGGRVFQLSVTLISDKAYKQAAEGLNYIVNKGKENVYYVPARIQLLRTQNQILLSGSFDHSQLLQLEKGYESFLQESGESFNTVSAMRQLAHLQAFYLNKSAEAAKEMEKVLKIANLPDTVTAYAKLELGDIYILTGRPEDAILIYGQVDKQFPDDDLGYEAKFRNARLSYFQDDFTWAKAQLEELRASTSRFIANDALNLSLLISENTTSKADSEALKVYAYAELLIFKNQFPQALAVLNDISVKFPGNSLADDVIMDKAKIYLRQNQFNEVTKQLNSIISNYSYGLWADDALFILADIYRNKLNQPSKAQELYQRLITDYPSSLHIADARIQFRKLRGDKISSAVSE